MTASSAVQQAESRLRYEDIVGTVAVGRRGLGTSKRESWGKGERVERRGMVPRETRKMEEELRQARVTEMGAQGAWTRWETIERKLTSGDIWCIIYTVPPEISV